MAIGNFDGVHRGHAALLARARSAAELLGLPLVVLTFEPHPRQFFKPDAAPFRLTPADVKAERLRFCGADYVEVVPFDRVLADMDATRFVDDILVGRFGAACVVVGADFHFGHNRGGTVESLKADGRFDVVAVGLEHSEGAPVSSTRIRAALLDGHMDAATAMLGWPWELRGEVVHGDKRGRTIGYPTANINLGETLCPAYGIYAVRVDIGDGQWRAGAASIGVRPMFALDRPILEVFLLDFDGDLYGRTLRVRPVRWLRGEMKFHGLEELVAQIEKDVAGVRAALA